MIFRGQISTAFRSLWYETVLGMFVLIFCMSVLMTFSNVKMLLNIKHFIEFFV